MPYVYSIADVPQLLVRRADGTPFQERLADGFVAELAVAAEVAELVDLAPRWYRIVDDALEKTLDEGETWLPVENWEYILPVPDKVTHTQAKLALLDAGLYEGIELFISMEPDAYTKLRYQIVWNANDWFRASVELNAIATSIGMTSGQIDDLFRAAALVQ